MVGTETAGGEMGAVGQEGVIAPIHRFGAISDPQRGVTHDWIREKLMEGAAGPYLTGRIKYAIRRSHMMTYLPFWVVREPPPPRPPS